MTAEDTKHHTRAIYIDVELSCWIGPPPVGMKQEIIEIGLVEMDLYTLKITREKAHFVRPKRWEISSRCTDLTGISKDDIRSARPFPEILASLAEEFSPSKALCCTWGCDADLIATACQSYGLRTPLRYLLDLADLFQRLFLLKQTPSLRSAVGMLDLEFDGVPHGAVVDARNTALVHASVIRRMRRQADLPTPTAQQTTEMDILTPFAKKLLQALGR